MRNKHFHNTPLLALAIAVLTVLALSLSSLTSAAQGVTADRTVWDNEFPDNQIGWMNDTTIDNYSVRLLLDNVSWTQTTDSDFRAGENLENVEVIGTGEGGSVRIGGIGDYWTSVADTLDTVGRGGSLVWTGGDSIYALQGNVTDNFWRYSISEDSWTSVADAPADVYRGGSLVWTGGDNIYALQGNVTDNFWRYSISDDSWTSVAKTPGTVSNGGSLVWTGGNNIYALRGGVTDNFWRYSISGDSWTSVAKTPGTVSYGGSLVWTGGDNIYAIRGVTDDFWRYSISGDSWTSVAKTPGTVAVGASLVWTEGDYIYTLQGAANDFWRYSISNNSWASMEDALGSIYPGGSLAWMGGENLYALQGENDFWRYTILPDLPYYSGIFISMAYNTGGVTDWGTISWDNYTPENTSLKIWTRTSHDNLNWSEWKKCENNAQVPSPENRYIQYKAIFSTDNYKVKPALDKIWIKYERYRSQGEFASIAWDGGEFFSSWDNLSWIATVPVNNYITWDTRTSPNNVSWSSWENLGDDNSIKSPDNRYLQVRATLTCDNTVTPLLHEYTIYYTVWILRVSVSILRSENSAIPGENVSFIVTVWNNGEKDDNYDLTAGDNAGWSLYIENEVLEVPSGEKRTTTLTATILEDALAHTEDNIIITATSQTDNTVSNNASCIARAEVVSGVQVSISPQENEGAPDVELEYTVTIKNTGNAEDNFTLGKTQTKNWGLGLPTRVGPLGPGEVDSVTLKVLIPSDAESGTEDKITVTATSRAEPSVSSENSCIARAIVRGVSVSISPQEDNAARDENVTFTVTVKNTGEVEDDYGLTVTDNAGWGAWLDDDLLEDVSPGTSRQTTVSVTAPSDVIRGDLTVISVTATSKANPNVSAENSCIVRAMVKGPSGFPWLPAAAVVVVGAIIVVFLVMRPFKPKPTTGFKW